MSENLKSCPFCGRKPNPDWTDESYIECTNRKCSLYGYGMSTGDWNNRPREDKLMAMVESLLSFSKPCPDDDYCDPELYAEDWKALDDEWNKEKL